MIDQQRRLLYLGGRTLFRDAMRAALGKAGLAVIPAASLPEAIEELDRNACEVALIDDDGFGEDRSLEAIATLARKAPSMRIGVLSSSRSAVFPADAIRDGAAGYLSKDMPLAELRYAIERMVRGQLVVDPTVTRSLLGILGPDLPLNPNGRVHLSPVERRVLAMASEGMANKQIAHLLGLSPLTVKNHVARIRARLGASDKAQAVAMAIRGGLLE